MFAISAPVAPVVAVAPKAQAARRSNAASTSMMRVWQPFNNKFFETLSYLPPLTPDAIARQVDYLTRNGMIPCIEFASAQEAIVSNANTVRMGPVTACYYDNRYWTMWKLPMFGCRDSNQVLSEIVACRRAFPDAYIRVVGFDNVRQVQCAGFLVNRPQSALPADRRSTA